jgi:hypothetical protein
MTMQTNTNDSQFAVGTQAELRCPLSLPARNHITDPAVIVLGGGFRLPSVRADRTADRGTVVLGGGFRMTAERAARTTDRGTIVLGGGFRLPTRAR